MSGSSGQLTGTMIEFTATANQTVLTGADENGKPYHI